MSKFKTTAVKDKDNSYKHFGIQDISAFLYGDKKEDIIEIEMDIDENQEINDDLIEYWGWFDFERNEFTMIYPSHFQLDLCFPAGIKTAEDNKQGKAYKLKIIK